MISVMPPNDKKSYAETLSYAAFDNTPARSRRWSIIVVAVTLGYAITIAVEGGLLAGQNQNTIILVHTISFGLFISVLIGYGIFMRSALKKIAMQYRQFASDNSLGYDDSSNYEAVGTLFSLGHDKSTGPRISGNIAGYPYAMYWHKHTTGYGKNSQEWYYGVVEITLPKAVPQIYLDHKDFEYVQEDQIGRVFGKDNLHQLEGEFSKRYKVYFNQRYASSALTLLNPQFMEDLLAFNSKYDFEFVDNRLFVYALSDFGPSRASFERLLDAAEFMATELQRQFDTFTFETENGDRGTMYVKASTDTGLEEAQYGW